jgi:hypothetical protein
MLFYLAGKKSSMNSEHKYSQCFFFIDIIILLIHLPPLTVLIEHSGSSFFPPTPTSSCVFSKLQLSKVSSYQFAHPPGEKHPGGEVHCCHLLPLPQGGAIGQLVLDTRKDSSHGNENCCRFLPRPPWFPKK